MASRMARCCSPCDEVQSRGGGYAIIDCLVIICGDALGFQTNWPHKRGTVVNSNDKYLIDKNLYET